MSKEKTTEIKKSRKALKIILKILTALLVLIAVLGIIAAIANAVTKKANLNLARSFDAVRYESRITPTDTDGYCTFTTDEDLKIMQLTDVHIGGGFMSAKKDAMAINAVAAMVTAEKPDLVIITGDIAYPVPFQAGTFNNKTGAEIFASLMETLGVYWAPCYGNHDTESYSFYSRKDISEFYSSDELKYCLFQAGDDAVDGYGNRAILVKNTKGVITQSLILFDSHSYTDGDFLGAMWHYDNIHDNQIEWYSSLVKSLNEKNAEVIETAYSTDEEKAAAMEKFGTVPSLAFYHIPSEEFKLAWQEYIANGRQDTENVKYYYGTAGESGEVVYCGIHPDDLFETMQTLGSTKGIFCGHDHLNNFSMDYKGIRLTYGFSVDYLAYSGIYKIGSQRGCTLITLTPDGTFDCVASNYYQDKYQTLAGNQKESVTMQDLDAEAAK